MHRGRTSASIRRRSTRKKGATLAVAGTLLFVASVSSGGAVLLISSSSEPELSTDLRANRFFVDQRAAAALPVKLGSTGKVVARLERRLRELGFDVEADRYFDAKTHRAVRAFQRDNGLEADGIVGAETWAALFQSTPAQAGGAARSTSAPAVGGRGQAAGDFPTGGPGGIAKAGERGARVSELDFAVRRASNRELEKVNLDGALSKPPAGDAGLVAIELRTPARQAGATKPVEKPNSSLSGRSSADSTNSGMQPNAGKTRADVTPRPSTGSCGTSLRHPLPSPYNRQSAITSQYGWRWGRMHEGIDIGAPRGTPVRAAACGIITYYGISGSLTSGYGRYACIRHTSTLTTCYAHLGSFVAGLKVGRYVTTGRLIGRVGSSGSSSGPHLHFETHSDVFGRDYNPNPYLFSGKQVSGTPVRSTAIGGPDLILHRAPQQPTSSPDMERNQESSEATPPTLFPKEESYDSASSAGGPRRELPPGGGAAALAEPPPGSEGTGEDDEFLEEGGPMPQNQSREGGEPAPVGVDTGEDDLPPRGIDQGLSADSGESEGQDSAGGDLPPLPAGAPDGIEPGMGVPPHPSDAVDPGMGGPPQSFPSVPLSGLPAQDSGCGWTGKRPLDPACSVPSP